MSYQFIMGLLLFTQLFNIQGMTYHCPPFVTTVGMTTFTTAKKCAHDQITLVQHTRAEQLRLIEINKNTKKMNVAVYIHEGMEILDFAGPVEVFSYAGFNVYTVARNENPILSQGIVKIIPEYTIDNCPKPDVLVFFGGNGTNASKEPATLEWLQDIAPKTDYLFTVCTGAFFLGRAGLLDELTVTTFHSAIPSLRELVPTATVLDDARFVDNGKVITTAGVSAGIDGALHMVQKLMGIEKAKEVAHYMEYDKWDPEDGVIK